MLWDVEVLYCCRWQFSAASSINREHRTKQHDAKAVGVKLTVGISSIGEPEEPGDVMVFLMQADLKEGFLNVSGDAILVGVKEENDLYQIIEKWWTGQKTVIDAWLVGRCTTTTHTQFESVL